MAKLTGPTARRHALGPQPGFGRFEQRLENGGIVDPFDEAEMAGGVVVLGQMQGIDLRRDAPDRNLAAPGQPEGAFGMLEERIVGRVEVDFPLEVKRRDPVRIVLVDVVRQTMESVPKSFALHRNDRYGALPVTLGG